MYGNLANKQKQISFSHMVWNDKKTLSQQRRQNLRCTSSSSSIMHCITPTSFRLCFHCILLFWYNLNCVFFLFFSREDIGMQQHMRFHSDTRSLPFVFPFVSPFFIFQTFHAMCQPVTNSTQLYIRRSSCKVLPNPLRSRPRRGGLIR